MESLSIWRLIIIGFWLGIGFIIPSIVTYILGTATIYKVTPFVFTTEEAITDTTANTNNITNYLSDYDKTSLMEVLSLRDNSSKGQLLILGEVKNNSEITVTSVQLEAELYDTDGIMVYECSEYISKRINAAHTENFQIKCGCEDNPIPEYKTFKVRVTKASTY